MTGSRLSRCCRPSRRFLLQVFLFHVRRRIVLRRRITMSRLSGIIMIVCINRRCMVVPCGEDS